MTCIASTGSASGTDSDPESGSESGAESTSDTDSAAGFITRFALICLVAVASSHCGYDVVFDRASSAASSGGVAAQGGNGWSGGAGAATGGTDKPDATAPVLSPTLRWQWQLQDRIDFSVSADLFAVDMFDVSDADLNQLRTSGRSTICTFSAGTREQGRPDVDTLPAAVLGKAMKDQPSETWLDVRSTAVRDLMTARMDRAVSRGCTGVLPDSVDGYQADTGFAIGTDESIAYLRFLSAEARKRSLVIGLSNAPALVPSVVSDFDYALQASCLVYDECDAYRHFVNASKPVLHVEFASDAADGIARQSSICEDTRRAGFSTIIKLASLNGWMLACE